MTWDVTFAYLATGIAFALIDSVWLRTMSERLYKVEIGELLADNCLLRTTRSCSIFSISWA